MAEVATSASAKNRALWSLVAQGLASVNGLVTTVVAARSMSPTEFGSFSVILTIALLAVGLTSAFLAQPLLISRSGTVQIAALTRSTLVMALVAGAFCGVLLLVAGRGFEGLRTGMFALSISFPLIAAGDTFRYCATVLGRTGLAAFFEAFRLSIFLVAYLLVSKSAIGAAEFAILWCGCAAVSGGLAFFAGRHLTKGSRAELRQFARFKFLGYQFAFEYFISVFGSSAPLLSLGWFVSVDAIGYFRAVSTLFGPILVLATTVVMVVSRYLVACTPRERSRALLAMGIGFNSATILWAGFLIAIPDAWGRHLLGEVWSGSHSLIVPVALQTVGIGILTTTQVGIRVVRPRYSFVMNVSAVACALGCFLTGVLVDGLHGAAWGFAVGAFGAACIGVAIYLRVKDLDPKESDSADGPDKER